MEVARTRSSSRVNCVDRHIGHLNSRVCAVRVARLCVNDLQIGTQRPRVHYDHRCIGQHAKQLVGACTSRPHPEAPRPITVLGLQGKEVIRPAPVHGATDRCSGSDGHTADTHRTHAHDAPVLKTLNEEAGSSQPLSVVLAQNDRDVPQRFRFHSKVFMPQGARDKTLILAEHCDGAKFCEPLFGHYLLPNGSLAHFYKHVRFLHTCVQQFCVCG
jgi:hypothetical protein